MNTDSRHSEHFKRSSTSHGTLFLREVLDKGTHQVSPLYFFASLNKERNPPYLQLRRGFIGKMLVFGFVFPKSASIVQQKKKMRKNQNVKRLRFSLNTTKHMYLKNVYLKHRLFTAMTPNFCSFTNTKQSLQYITKPHLGSPPMPKFEANMNYIPPSPPNAMTQCKKSATVKFHMELLLTTTTTRKESCSFCDTIILQ